MTYGVMFWMPFYLGEGLELDGREIGVLASLFDLGGVAGSIIFGHLSDRLSSRVLVIAPLVFATLPLLVLFLLVSADVAFLLFAIVPFLGVAILSPTNLIGSTVASDLSQKTEMEGNRRVLGTITGIIDGTGSAAAALGMFIIGFLQDFSWTYVFLFLICKRQIVNGTVASMLLFLELKKTFRKSQLHTPPRTPSFGTELESKHNR